MRTPLTIFALGLGGCLALGLMMQHLLRVSQERNQPSVLREINRTYGSRFDGEARLRYVHRPEGTIAEISFTPLVSGGSRELARDVGQFLWRNEPDEDFTAIEVVCEDPLGGGYQRFAVERPIQPVLTRSSRPGAPPAAAGKTPAGARTAPTVSEKTAPRAPPAPRATPPAPTPPAPRDGPR